AWSRPAAPDTLLYRRRRAWRGAELSRPCFFAAEATGGTGKEAAASAFPPADGANACQPAVIRDLRLPCGCRLPRQPRPALQSAAAGRLDFALGRPDPRARAVRKSVGMAQSLVRTVAPDHGPDRPWRSGRAFP